MGKRSATVHPGRKKEFAGVSQVWGNGRTSKIDERARVEDAKNHEATSYERRVGVSASPTWNTSTSKEGGGTGQNKPRTAGFCAIRTERERPTNLKLTADSRERGFK